MDRPTDRSNGAFRATSDGLTDDGPHIPSIASLRPATPNGEIDNGVIALRELVGFLLFDGVHRPVTLIAGLYRASGVANCTNARFPAIIQAGRSQRPILQTHAGHGCRPARQPTSAVGRRPSAISLERLGKASVRRRAIMKDIMMTDALCRRRGRVDRSGNPVRPDNITSVSVAGRRRRTHVTGSRGQNIANWTLVQIRALTPSVRLLDVCPNRPLRLKLKSIQHSAQLVGGRSASHTVDGSRPVQLATVFVGRAQLDSDGVGWH